MAPTSPTPQDTTTATVTPPPDGKPVELDTVRAALEADYEILSELGRGGMAVVYKAREKELDREVAVKVLPTQMSFDAEFVERFQREARTAGKLEHPNIVPIYRVGRAGLNGSIIYFVMKLLTGQSLATVLKARRKLPAPEVRRILLDVASALGYAAKRGTVHRDIKPDNILLDGEGRCVVTDFGIAKTRTGPHTAPGTSMGTPRYMSPEHAQGNKVDGRSDIYSLGVVGYQCLAGATPFDADDPFAVLYKHINEPIPRPALETDDEWALYATIEKMLAKKPEDRFQTADELITALGGEVHTVTLVHSRESLQQAAFGATEIIPTPMPWRQQKVGGIPKLAWLGVAGVFVFGSIAYGVWGPDRNGGADQRRDTAAARSGAEQRRDTAALKTAAASISATNIGAAGSRGPKAESREPVSIPPKPVAPVIPASEKGNRCPRNTKAGPPAVVLDSVAPFQMGRPLRVRYSVCGLPPNTAFTSEIHVVRLDRGSFIRRGVEVDVTREFPDVAETLKQRRVRTMDLGSPPASRYSLTVTVKDARGLEATVNREFVIVKPPEKK